MMDDEITLHPGILGTRKLAAALATLLLRKRGKLNTYIPRGEFRKGPWTPEEHKTAMELRAKGKNFAEIGRALRRTRTSVHSKFNDRRAA